MHPFGHRNAIGRDDIQFERVLIDLSEQGRSRNGECKGLGGLTCMRDGFGSLAQGYQFRFIREAMDFPPHLIVGGDLDWFPSSL